MSTIYLINNSVTLESAISFSLYLNSLTAHLCYESQNNLLYISMYGDINAYYLMAIYICNITNSLLLKCILPSYTLNN